MRSPVRALASRIPCRLAALLLVGFGFTGLPADSALAQVPYSFDVVPPELVGGPSLNTPKEEPLRLANRKGKVTIVHFWTFG